MTGEQITKVIDTAKAAGITTYDFATDIYAHFYHDGENSFVKYDSTNDVLFNVRSSNYGGAVPQFGQNKILVMGADPIDVHEARIAGDYDQIKTFLENFGLDLSDDELKIMVDLNKMNYDIIPETGDYNRFVPLSKKQYDALTPEEKEEYDAAKAKDDEAKANYIGQHAAASISY